MRVLSIDPGFDRLGIAVIDKDNGKETLIFSTCVQTTKEDTYPDRLRTVGDELDRLIEEHKPDIFATETLFFANNQRTAIDVAGSRGVFLYIAKKYNLPIFEYTPVQIKVAVTGYGKSDKAQVTDMVQRLIHVETKDRKILDDEYDAIAIGLTCLAIERP